MKYSDDKILIGIKCNNKQVLDYCYATFFKTIKRYVIKNKGTVHDAKDIFQETIEYFYIKPNINVKKKFAALFCTVCFNKWKRKILEMKNTERMETISENSLITEPFEELEFVETYNLKYEIFFRHFERLDNLCKNLLIMFYSKTSKEKISKELGISVGYINRRKTMCKTRLKENIRMDIQNLNTNTGTYIL
ncbi:MAG: hypothetical protein A2275_03270 [Bacteroidetes bacterium RIFOXYA12_FULL_35_11]|nr:MAG: hypothetical protein A2X01_08780 [Bacteroidetes bacterium GWF2_35_48]OFY72558.1 MAG: hypothetical protein A2275_03270 [Bacteroidetes bacterium RIFOXYA12_FULL_35_11]OFY93344.1 MAG: hypothetical protein A2491_07780 [Bacteroidetes bacterium RIFOXYC12_FULL_35_7]OFY97268.1 MAG: hypothetical protein A2309_10950 [Bacteroidetes bacterium RIFOXYB2_FULL_35_7]HBX52503.1 hypothetical protein [Bacteroidales bacterium]